MLVSLGARWDKECGKSAHIASCGNSSGNHGSNRNTWNANSWPYESSRVIAGLARVLHNAGYASAVAAAETKAVSVETCKSSCCSFVVGCSRHDTH